MGENEVVDNSADYSNKYDTVNITKTPDTQYNVVYDHLLRDNCRGESSTYAHHDSDRIARNPSLLSRE
jgi:hypothetical protein